MAIAVTGGQGNVTATIQNTDASTGTVKVGEGAIFTTPATANAIFRVTLSGSVIAGGFGTSTATADVSIILPGSSQTGGGPTLSGGGVGFLEVNADGDMTLVASELYVGPSTDVKFTYILGNPAAEQAEFTYNISYHYAATVVT